MNYPAALAASWDTFGPVYIGFAGSSLAWGQLASDDSGANSDHVSARWTDQAEAPATGQKVSRQLEYYHNTGSAQIHVRGTPPGGSMTDVPQNRLIP